MVSSASLAFSFEKSWLSRISLSRALPFLTWAFLSWSSREGNFGPPAWGGLSALAMVAEARNTTARRERSFFNYVPFLKLFDFVTENGSARSKSMPSKKGVIRAFLVALLTRREKTAGHELSTVVSDDPREWQGSDLPTSRVSGGTCPTASSLRKA